MSVILPNTPPNTDLVTEPAWKDLLKGTRISDIIKKRPLVTAQYHEEVSTILKRMSGSKVLAALVVDPDPKTGVLGFVDVLDLLSFVLETAELSSKSVTDETFQNLKWEGQCFEIERIGNLMNASRADPMYTVSCNSSLWDAVKLMSLEVHRLAVIEPGTPAHTVSNIIAQSDIVSFIATRGVWLGSKLEQSLSEVGLARRGVATVLEDNNVISTLRYMRDFKVSGVGVVDKFGRLVANFSATDLLGLTAETFPLLSLSVKEYLNRVYGFHKPPVFCRATESVETMLLKMVVHQVHRIYLIDELMIPVGIVSMTDVMQFLLS